MNGMSATPRRIDRQAGDKREVWHHKPTNRRAVLVMEVAGACELEGIDGNSIYAMRVDLDNPEVWSRIT
jgi:hypothetical protein